MRREAFFSTEGMRWANPKHVATLVPTSVSRPLAHPVIGPPVRDMPWRNLTARWRSGFSFHSDAAPKVRAGASQNMGSPTGSAPGHRFFDEAEAERLALNPRLPHHRHRLTADEAVAGILIVAICGAAIIYAMVKWL